MRRKEHWERVYTTKGEQDVSWFESLPAVSLEMLEASGLTRETCVLDLGGGDSRLVDHLAGLGMDCLAVLDVSGAALRRAQSRPGETAKVPVWIEADVTGDWSLKPMDIWHDRAVFHFLTTTEDQARYLEHLRAVLKVQGSAIIARSRRMAQRSVAACRSHGTPQNHLRNVLALASRWWTRGGTSTTRRGARRKPSNILASLDCTKELSA